MTFQSLQAKYKRLLSEHRAWSLLRADNAPYILAFIESLFSDENEVEYGQARLLLEAEIERSRELGIWETETNANTYLNQWIRQGWLREMDNQLTKTDAVQTALRFARQLEERATGTTASHLRIVQDAVRDFVVALSSNTDDRLALLEQKKAEIQREIDALQAGILVELDDNTKRERIREIYQLCSLLTGDFRLLEEEIRHLDQELRIQMIAEDSSRGKVLQSIMEKEELLAKTEAGNAFEGFFQLLCDANRATEFREQIRLLLENDSVSQHLLANQSRFLAQLMNELNNESQRIFRIRRRTEQELRAYIESGQAQENQAVDRLISQLEKLAVEFGGVENLLQKSTALSLPVGPIIISSPQSMRLKQPDEQLETNTQLQINPNQASDAVLASLQSVNVRQVAKSLQHILQQQGVLSIAGLVQHRPVRAGLEELVSYVRVAKAIRATELEEKESVIIEDRQGNKLKVSVPTLLLSADLFPSNMDELNF